MGKEAGLASLRLPRFRHVGRSLCTRLSWLSRNKSSRALVYRCEKNRCHGQRRRTSSLSSRASQHSLHTKVFSYPCLLDEVHLVMRSYLYFTGCIPDRPSYTLHVEPVRQNSRVVLSFTP